MTERELIQKRIENWRIRPDLAPNDEKEIREFIKQAGFCYTYHIPRDTIPSLLQTISGSVDLQIAPGYSETDPFNAMLNETFRSYTRQRLFVEVIVFGKHPVIVYRDVFMRLYRLMGSSVRGGYLTRRKRNTRLENDVITFLNEKRTASRKELRLTLLTNKHRQRNELSAALESLGRQLKIVRLRQSGGNELEWATPESWHPELCGESARLDRGEAIDYLIIRLLRTAVAASRKAVHRFFRYTIPADVLDQSLNSLVQRGVIRVDSELIIDGKHALVARE
jgi:hypothetical protein